MKVLLSIKPEYVDKILDGTKKYEFRKNIFKRDGIKTVVIYATMPIGKVVAEFNIEEVLQEEPDRLWGLTKNLSGISKKFFDEYYAGKEKAVAIRVGKVTKYVEPLSLSTLGKGIVAPQSYRYLN